MKASQQEKKYRVSIKFRHGTEQEQLKATFYLDSGKFIGELISLIGKQLEHEK